MVLGREARQNRRDEYGIRTVGNGCIRPELLGHEQLEAGLRKQFELQALRGESRDLLETTPGMARNGDKRHVKNPSYRGAPQNESMETKRRALAQQIPMFLKT
jgi:hypothetical protein